MLCLKLLAAGKRIFDQIVDVVEGNLVDDFLDLAEPGRFPFEKDHKGGFDRWTAGLDARDLFDDDGHVFGKSEILPGPVADLVESERGDVQIFSAERIGSFYRSAVPRSQSTHEPLPYPVQVEIPPD